MRFEEPRKCVREIKEIHEIFHFSTTFLKRQIKVALPSGCDFSQTIHSIVKDSSIRAALESLVQVLDDFKYLSGRLSRIMKTHLRRLVLIRPHSRLSLIIGLLVLGDLEFDRLLRCISLRQKTEKQFTDLPVVNYTGYQKTLEELVTVQMTYIMDGRVIDFFEGNRADAQLSERSSKRKQSSRKIKFQKLKEAFPCILAGIRDYAEYIPLEPEIFDLLIIDEASQVSIAQAFPALLRAKKVLILGDKKQFSNVKAAQARSDTNTEYLNRLRDLFKKTISDSSDKLVRLEKFNIKTSILDFFEFISNYNTQLMKYFRGYKEIISYSNKYFYQNTLQVMKIRGKPIEDVLSFPVG